MSGYRGEVTTPRDKAAILAAKAEALASIEQIRQTEATLSDLRAQRDAAIHRMNRAGSAVPEISRELDYPPSTVRQSIRMAIVRAANNS